jgi:hypothetical protein
MTTKQHTNGTRFNPITLLDEEWKRLLRCGKTLAVVNSWRITPSPFTSLDELLQAAGYRGKKIDPVADQVLAQLVRRAASDQLAARIVLQRVFPPMIAVARRRGKFREIGFDEALASVLSHGWEVIRTYPIQRRPTKIAANIVRDTEYFAFVRGQRGRPTNVSFDHAKEHITNVRCAEPGPGETHDARAEGDGAAPSVLRELLCEAKRRNISDRSLRVLESLCEKTIAEFAVERGITERMARNLRRDAVNELRERTLCAA